METSILFNVPANKVQIDNNNRFNGMNQKDLNNYFLNGFIIDLESLEKIIPNAPHYEVNFNLIKEV
jgi:hypothetical protein